MKTPVLQQPPGTKCNIFANFFFPSPNRRLHQPAEHESSSSMLSGYCLQMQQSTAGRCIRVSLLYKVFSKPGASWRARLLDNYPQEYQKSSSKHDNKPPSAQCFSKAACLNCVFRVTPSSRNKPFALTSVAP